MRRAAKRDDNEALIVTALQSAGWTVVRVSDAGAPDLLVARNGVLTLVEVKGPKGTLTGTQKVAFERLAGAGVHVQVVRSPQEALSVVGCPWDGVARNHVATHRWLAENGAFLCESCWLPENGLHAPKCPSRTALKPKPKVQSAHRAAKKMAEEMPQAFHDMVIHGEAAVRVTAGGVFPVNLRPSRGVEGELQPISGFRMAPKFMQDAIKSRKDG